MRRFLFCLLAFGLVSVCVACGNGEPRVVETVSGTFAQYDVMSDGTYQCDGVSYAYRLEISGRMPNAVKDSTFVYLSNIEDISFQRAYMAAGLSSNSNDYFSREEAILVEWR